MEKDKKRPFCGKSPVGSPFYDSDKEAEIKAFVPEEYWTVTALFRKQKEFSAKLHQYMGQKIALSKEEDTDRVLSAIKGMSSRWKP
jgi:DNA topoisomerase IA